MKSRRASETTVPALPAGTTLADLSMLLDGLRLRARPAGEHRSRPGSCPTSMRSRAPSTSTATPACSRSAASPMRLRAATTAASPSRTPVSIYRRTSTSTGGIPVRGDLGVRYSRTKQTSQGYLPAGGAPVLLTAVHEYSDVLPVAQSRRSNVTPDLLVRFAAAKVMTRPALGQVTPGGTTSLVGNLGVATGNPYLDPTRANNLRPGARVVLRRRRAVVRRDLLQGHRDLRADARRSTCRSTSPATRWTCWPAPRSPARKCSRSAIR